MHAMSHIKKHKIWSQLILIQRVLEICSVDCIIIYSRLIMNSRSQDPPNKDEGVFDRFYASCFRKNNRTQAEHFSTILNVSNKNNKYRLKHGLQFSAMLEPRDQILEHDFDFTFEISSNNWNNEHQTLVSSKAFVEIMKDVKNFLVEASCNVVSVAFKFLNEGKLQGSEAKQYASKNIMLNVQAIFHNLTAAIQQNQQLMSRISIEQLRQDLVIEIDHILNSIFINLADSYPVAPTSGGTQRMRQVIHQVNRVYDDQNDFIYTSGTKIRDYITYKDREQNGEIKKQIVFNEQKYTLFIMTVINEAIMVTQKNQEDSRERSVKQIFTEFNEQLFWLAQQKKYQQTISKLDFKKMKGNTQLEIAGRVFQKDKFNNKLSNYFNRVLERNQEKLNICLGELYEKKDEFENKSYKMKQHSKISLLSDLAEQSQDGVLNMYKEKKFAMGQKIPAFVQPFSKQQLITNTFTVKHSSVLRVLTKWAQYLQEIFKDAEQIMNKKLYPFKNFDNQLLPSSSSAFVKSHLVKRLKKEYKIVQKKFQLILKSNFSYIGQFLSGGGSDSFVSNVSRYAQTRVLSSKISTILTSLMVGYTCELIHHLVLAGHNLENQLHQTRPGSLSLSSLQNNQSQSEHLDVNLIVFKVSDLMRSKIQCSQNSFIALLKTVYLLDDCEQMNDRFKLVRIKNKLDMSTNNVMINYLFLGKIQCEMQISIQEAQGKAKNYNTMSHFVYELLRGKYGSITELAIMISQLDSMMASCKEVIYAEKSMKRLVKTSYDKNTSQMVKGSKKINAEKRIQEKNISQGKQLVQAIKNFHFICKICKKMAIKQNRGIFIETSEKICNLCITQNRDFQSLYSNSRLKKLLMHERQTGMFERTTDILQLMKIKDYRVGLYVTETGRVDPYLTISVPKDDDWYLIKLQEEILQNFSNQNFNFQEIYYFSIKDMLKNGFSKGTNNIFLAYLLSPNYIYSDQLCQLVNIPYYLLNTKIQHLVKQFRLYRTQIRIIRSIKFKSEIIQVNNDSQEYNIYDKVGRVLVMSEQSDQQKDRLRYKRYDNLELLNIKKIEVVLENITEVPKWLSSAHNLKILILSNNSLKQISKRDLPNRLHELMVDNNHLTSVDISELSKLVRLDLSNNKIASINLSNLNNLQHLSLGMNCLQKIHLSGQKKLLTLMLPKLNLTEIDLSAQPELKVLNVSHNELEYIDFTANQMLQEINLQNNKFQNIRLQYFGQLTRLNLVQNPLNMIKLGNLRNMQKFSINGTKTLKSIQITTMFKLKELNLDNNEIQTLQLANLPELAILSMKDNAIQNLTLIDLNNLKKLEYEGNKLQKVKVYGLPKMTELTLRNCRISSIDISTLGNLVSLDLSHNELYYLALGGLTRLKNINLSHNKLPQIDLIDQIQLQKAILAHNQLVNVHFTYQPDILEADVSNNRLQNLYLGQNKKLRVLQVHNNSGWKAQVLPQTLEVLTIDRDAVEEFDLRKLKRLVKLKKNGEGNNQLNDRSEHAIIRKVPLQPE